MLDPSKIISKIRGKLDPKVIAVIKKYMDGVDKGRDKGGSAVDGGRNSKNRLTHDII